MLRDSLVRKKQKKSRWHDFNMNVFYFIMLIYCLSSAFFLITGRLYTENAILLDKLYENFSGLHALNFIYGIIMIIFSIIAIYIRYAFCKEFSGTYKWFVISIIAYGVLMAIYKLISAKVRAVPLSALDFAVGIVICFLLAVINYEYYRKREE